MKQHAFKPIIAAYLASIGSKGGKAKGASKRRSPEHYKRLAAMKKKPLTPK